MTFCTADPGFLGRCGGGGGGGDGDGGGMERVGRIGLSWSSYVKWINLSYGKLLGQVLTSRV